MKFIYSFLLVLFAIQCIIICQIFDIRLSMNNQRHKRDITEATIQNPIIAPSYWIIKCWDTDEVYSVLANNSLHGPSGPGNVFKNENCNIVGRKEY